MPIGITVEKYSSLPKRVFRAYIQTCTLKTANNDITKPKYGLSGKVEYFSTVIPIGKPFVYIFAVTVLPGGLYTAGCSTPQHRTSRAVHLLLYISCYIFFRKDGTSLLHLLPKCRKDVPAEMYRCRCTKSALTISATSARRGGFCPLRKMRLFHCKMMRF